MRLDEAAAVVGEDRRVGVGARRRIVRPASMRRIVRGGVGAEVGVGHPGLLEVEDVEEGVAEDLAHQLDRRHRRRGARTARSCRPRPRRARGRAGPAPTRPSTPQSWPTNTARSSPRSSSRASRSSVRCADVVVLDRLGPARPAVAPLVGGEDPVAGGGERRAPGGATSRPARGSRGRGRRAVPRPPRRRGARRRWSRPCAR